MQYVIYRARLVVIALAVVVVVAAEMLLPGRAKAEIDKPAKPEKPVEGVSLKQLAQVKVMHKAIAVVHRVRHHKHKHPFSRKHPSTPKKYTVRHGDCLYFLAQRFFGDGRQWRKIYHDNQAVIGRDPNLIRPGQELAIIGGTEEAAAVSTPARLKRHHHHGEHNRNTVPVADDDTGSGPTHHELKKFHHDAKPVADGLHFATVTKHHYRNPLRHVSGLIAERIDMGVDYSGSGPLYAIGTGTIEQVYSSGWPGGVYIRLKLLHGPYAGKQVFYAESIRPRVHVGQHVKSGTVIGEMYLGGTGIEMGWSEPFDSTPMAYGAYSEGLTTAYGKNFSDFLHALGAPRGIVNTGLAGSVGAGFYDGRVGHYKVRMKINGELHRRHHKHHHEGIVLASSACRSGAGAGVGYLPDNYQAIVDYLVAHGYTDNAAAGIAGNMWQESHGNPNSVGSGGGGLIGFTPFVPGEDGQIGDLISQLAAVVRYNERFGSKGAINAASSSPAAAAEYYEQQYERAGIPAMSNRVAAAEAVARACGF